MKLRGNCPAKVDEKGRLKVPAVFLEGLKEFGTQFYITSVTGETARIYPMNVWSETGRQAGKAAGVQPGQAQIFAADQLFRTNGGAGRAGQVAASRGAAGNGGR